MFCHPSSIGLYGSKSNLQTQRLDLGRDLSRLRGTYRVHVGRGIGAASTAQGVRHQRGAVSTRQVSSTWA